jgi:ABC-2 type transport system ATP-binding protein
MPEHDCLPPDVSATEFVAHMARVSGLPAGAARERTADVLRHVGLYEERYRQIGGYSTGMKQRVKLAQALVHDPRVLFLDEPTNGLDPAGRDEMLALIERIGREFGITAIVASHLLGEIERIAGWLVAIDAGKLLRTAPLASFTQRTGQLLVETDEDAEPFAARLTERGLDAKAIGRTVVVDLASASGGEYAAFDAVRDESIALGLPLIRVEHRRHQLEDLFRDADDRVA